MISNRKKVLFLIGCILLVLSISLMLYDRVGYAKEMVFNEIELKKFIETNDEVYEMVEDEDVTDEVIEEIDLEEINKPVDKTDELYKDDLSKSYYIGYLEIPKINVVAGLVSMNSWRNYVDYNVQTLKVSKYPNVINSNLVLASHSGTSKVSYFRYLYKIGISDNAYVTYKGYRYTYSVVDIYNVPKTGGFSIRRDFDKNTLTLITCTKNSKTEQTVYILELIDKVRSDK